MSRKRILLIESGQFLGGVIHSLFTSCEKFEVFSALPTDWQKLVVAVREIEPDIVIMDDTLESEFLANLLIYMQNSEVTRVIIVNTDSNQVQLYNKQQIQVRQTEDFFAIL